MRRPWKQTAPIKRHAINLAAGLNSLCPHLCLVNGARRFLESGYFAAATLTFGRVAATMPPWGYGIHKASNKNDRIVVSSAWLACSKYAHHCFSLVTVRGLSCIRSIVPLR